MYLTELQKLGVLKTGYQSQHARLLAVAKMVLETDEPERIGHQILLPKLNACIRFFTCPWIAQALWFHRTKAQSFHASPGDLLDRQTRFKPARFLEAFQRHRLSHEQFVDERLILGAVHRAIDVIVATLIVSGRLERDRHVDRIGRYDRCDRVVKIELVVACEFHYRRR